jgi:hypothetical protein
LEKQQKTVTEEFNRAYPPLYFYQRILRHRGREFVAVVIPGSAKRPHFTGKSYVRVGPETKEASEEQFNALIAERLSEPYEILRWRGKQITVDYMHPERNMPVLGRVQSTQVLTVTSCTPFYVTLQSGASEVCISLTRVAISFDSENKRLRLEVVPV